MGELLPNAQEARIDPRKLRDYVLDFSHPSGRFKAPFFAQIGYSVENWQRLELDIREQHLIELAKRGSPSPFWKEVQYHRLANRTEWPKSVGYNGLDFSAGRDISRFGDSRAGQPAKEH